MRRAARASALLGGLALAANPAVLAADLTPACSFEAFAIDPDPTGTNIRAAPRAAAMVIARLPPRVFLSSVDVVGMAFTVIGSRRGWLQIRDVEMGQDPKTGFERHWAGPGWISGRLVGVELRSAVLRSAPRRDAVVVAQLMDVEHGIGPDSYRVTAVRACDGPYAEVDATAPDGRRLHGWSWKPCAAQLTTCDGGGEAE